jgi:hypothetical protein
MSILGIEMLMGAPNKKLSLMARSPSRNLYRPPAGNRGLVYRPVGTIW